MESVSSGAERREWRVAKYSAPFKYHPWERGP